MKYINTTYNVETGQTTTEERDYTSEELKQIALLCKEGNKQQAIELLKQTDWIELPSVSDISNNPHLINKDEFITYRNALRLIAIDPASKEITFPTIPTEKWSN